MTEFHDATGRPRPSTWEAGSYPDGGALMTDAPSFAPPSIATQLLNNGEPKTPNGEFRRSRRLLGESTASATKRRRSEPAHLAIPAGLL